MSTRTEKVDSVIALYNASENSEELRIDVVWGAENEKRGMWLQVFGEEEGFVSRRDLDCVVRFSGLPSLPYDEQYSNEVVVFTTKLPRMLIRDLLPNYDLMLRLLLNSGLVSLALEFNCKPSATDEIVTEGYRELVDAVVSAIAQRGADDIDESDDSEREDDDDWSDVYAGYDLWLVGVRAAIPLYALNKRTLEDALDSLAYEHNYVVDLLKKHGFLS